MIDHIAATQPRGRGGGIYPAFVRQVEGGTISAHTYVGVAQTECGIRASIAREGDCAQV
ncbi:MAG: hypothetical protein MR517_05160 [Bacteroidales bacterium]|nr:hypothetical protein [Bacteroidales bacterium]